MVRSNAQATAMNPLRSQREELTVLINYDAVVGPASRVSVSARSSLQTAPSTSRKTKDRGRREENSSDLDHPSDGNDNAKGMNGIAIYVTTAFFIALRTPSHVMNERAEKVSWNTLASKIGVRFGWFIFYHIIIGRGAIQRKLLVLWILRLLSYFLRHSIKITLDSG